MRTNYHKKEKKNVILKIIISQNRIAKGMMVSIRDRKSTVQMAIPWKQVRSASLISAWCFLLRCLRTNSAPRKSFWQTPHRNLLSSVLIT